MSGVDTILILYQLFHVLASTHRSSSTPFTKRNISATAATAVIHAKVDNEAAVELQYVRATS